ncbi:methionine synthase [soil metagenome]|jgi:5-methyltetrahydropteroyltriglutamate--homocysteine methyltransferase
MSEVRFVTREIGSLAKPGWRVKSIAGRPVEETDIEYARKWGERLGIDTEELTGILQKGQGFSDEDKVKIHAYAASYGIRLLESSGLDVVYDGEQRRSEMYDHAVKHARGFETRGTVRSWDNKYYTKAAVVEKPLVETVYDLEEYEFVIYNTDRTIKVPFTGAYTVMDWSYDEYYAGGGEAESSLLGASAGRRMEARRQFGVDAARDVVRPNVAGIVEAGADWVQIDEPAATTRPEEVPLVVETFNAIRADIDARCSMHICFSDYSCLFPHIEELDDCYELQLEFSNRDSLETGTKAESRPGYAILDKFRESAWEGKIGLGVIDIHTDYIEPPELVRDRVLYAAGVLGPDRIEVNTDCGLRTRSWAVSYGKLANMVEGTRLAEKELNGS